MIISHKYKFIFIKTRKTAGTSVEVYLSPYCSSNDIFTRINPKVQGHTARNYSESSLQLNALINNFPENLRPTIRRMRNNIKYYNHIPASQVKAYLTKNIWNNYYKFCIERNPWDKVISHYHWINKYKRNSQLKFTDYIKERNFPKNIYLYTSLINKVIVDKILRYEALNNELDTLFKKLGIPFNGELKVKAKSNYRTDKRHYREYFTDYTRKIIIKEFKKEIDLHGYRF